jgi:hypothetical protein
MYVRIVVSTGNYTTKYVLPFVIDGHSALVRQPKQCLKRGELHPRGLHHFVPPTTHLFRGGHAVVCQTHQKRTKNAPKTHQKIHQKITLVWTWAKHRKTSTHVLVDHRAKTQQLRPTQKDNRCKKEVPFQLSNHLPSWPLRKIPLQHILATHDTVSFA